MGWSAVSSPPRASGAAYDAALRYIDSLITVERPPVRPEERPAYHEGKL